MKYVVKFIKEYWVLFNTETYENTQIFFLKRECEEAVKKMNQRK